MSVRRTAAALLGIALLLTGCTDDAEPRFEPIPSASPSESETSAEPEAQTPEEFIREWFAAALEMQNSGRTEPVAELSRDCQPCRDLIGTVESIYESGGSIRIDSVEVTRVEAV